MLPEIKMVDTPESKKCDELLALIPTAEEIIRDFKPPTPTFIERFPQDWHCMVLTHLQNHPMMKLRMKIEIIRKMTQAMIIEGDWKFRHDSNCTIGNPL